MGGPGPSAAAGAACARMPRGRLAYRRPGTPFGLQAQVGQGGIGNPPAAAAPGGAFAGQGRVAPASGCGGGGFGGRGGAPVATDTNTRGGNPMRRSPGFYSSAFADGYTLSLMIADATTGVAKETWHNASRDSPFTSLNNMMWADDRVVFPVTVPKDEYERWYSLSVNGGTPVRLTTTDGLIEDATSVALSPDGKTMFYCTNASDIERRHIWSVPTAGGAAPVRISAGDGIETYPQPLASGKSVAVIYFDAHTPASIALVPTQGAKPTIVFPKLGKDFPTAAHVTPEIVWTTAADGMKISNQLFLPKT